jgi:hypothetical protein
MHSPGFFQRVGESILAGLLLPVVALAIGLPLVMTGLFVALAQRFDWIGGPALTLISAGLFLVLAAPALAYLPRVWRPKGMFGKRFGSASLLMGLSEQRNRHVLRQAPRVRSECQRLASKLREFTEREMKSFPKEPVEGAGDVPRKPTPERMKFNADVQAFLERFTTLYDNTWRRDVEAVLLDARAMFFGPIPLTTDRFIPGRAMQPDNVRHLAISLDRLAQTIPEVYSAPMHAAHVERLVNLKHQGLGLATDLGLFLQERHKAAEVKQQELPTDKELTSHDLWQLNQNFDKETSALFASRFGGSVIHVVKELNASGLADEVLERLVGPFGLMTVSSYDLGALAASIAALCQKIPYE